jgi:hypothetical protein
MKRTNFPDDKQLPFQDSSRNHEGTAECIVFVSTLALICLYLWLILSFWFD